MVYDAVLAAIQQERPELSAVDLPCCASDYVEETRDGVFSIEEGVVDAVDPSGEAVRLEYSAEVIWVGTDSSAVTDLTTYQVTQLEFHGE